MINKTFLRITVLFISLLGLGIVSSFGQQVVFVEGKYYKNGMLYTGETKEYYPDSTLKLIRTIRNGKENGTTSYYFSNGQIMEQREYRDGEKNGEWLNWNEKGIKIARAGYKNDKKEGEWLI